LIRVLNYQCLSYSIAHSFQRNRLQRFGGIGKVNAISSTASVETEQSGSKSEVILKRKIPPLDAEPPLRVLVLVEPTPFTYISGYANRFKEMLRYLKDAGDVVHIFTADPNLANAPKDFMGFPISTVRGFSFPLYKQVTLTFDLKFQLGKLIDDFKPDIIHVSTPSAVLNPAILWAKIKNIPLIMSYHTNLVEYGKAYLPLPGVVAFANFLLMLYHSPADYVLCTSPQLQADLQALGHKRVGVWQKGINTELFSPKFRDSAMRARLAGGEENAGSSILIYVGRLGFEKRLDRLKSVLDRVPGTRLALVGSGPAEKQLREIFRDYPVVFTGALQGEELSRAYASGDIFVMPSDSETLGFVVLEALASGLPAVGVRAGGLVDIIVNEETGYLVNNNDDMVEFSQRVAELVKDNGLRQRMGSNGLAWAQGWSWEAATSVLRNIQYRAAIALHKARDEKGRHVADIEAAIVKNSVI